MTAVPDILVLDTCVLISSVLRRLLLRMAEQGCFEPAWSARIGREWRGTGARLWQASAEDVRGQWEALQAAFPQADQGDVAAFEQGLRYSDPKDWHVIAAALAAQQRNPGKSVAVVTRNTRDFSRGELRRRGLALLDPDRLLEQCWQADAAQVRKAWREVCADYALAGIDAEETGELLRRERLFRLHKLYGDGC